MSKDENVNAILRWFEALNNGDIDLLDKLVDELFTPDFTAHAPRLTNFEKGPAGAKRFIRQVLKENTGVQATVNDIFASEDKIAYRFTVSMTNIASGEPVNMQIIDITHFFEGKAVEAWRLSAPGKW